MGTRSGPSLLGRSGGSLPAAATAAATATTAGAAPSSSPNLRPSAMALAFLVISILQEREDSSFIFARVLYLDAFTCRDARAQQALYTAIRIASPIVS